MYYNYSLDPYGRRWETLKAGVRNFLFFIEFGFTEACDVNADAICGSPYSLVGCSGLVSGLCVGSEGAHTCEWIVPPWASVMMTSHWVDI